MPLILRARAQLGQEEDSEASETTVWKAMGTCRNEKHQGLRVKNEFSQAEDSSVVKSPCELLCRSDTRQSHLGRKTINQSRTRSYQIPLGKSVTHSLGWCSTWKGPAHCGRYHPWAGGPESIRKQAGPVTRSKPVNSTPQLPGSELLPPGP